MIRGYGSCSLMERAPNCKLTAPNFHRFVDHPSRPRSTPRIHAETEIAVIPRMPQEVIDEILGRLADSDLGSLRSCALASRSWAPSSRRHLLHTVTFTWLGMERWIKIFPVPEESPAHLVRDLGFRVRGSDHAPKKFFAYIPWFANVERVTFFSRQGMSQSLQISWYWRFPQTATSSTISADSIAITQIRDIMV